MQHLMYDNIHGENNLIPILNEKKIFFDFEYLKMKYYA